MMKTDDRLSSSTSEVTDKLPVSKEVAEGSDL